MTLRLGKLPATHDRRDLQFANYRTTPKLPSAPIGYGHKNLVHNPWGMLGNDEWGDCAIAGPAHEHMLTSATAGQQVTFPTSNILHAYSNITGFDPNAGPYGNNPTDQGASVRQVLKYRQKHGLTDSAGRVHKIGAYVALEPGNWTELLEALYLFETVGFGFQFPSSAMTQFNAHKPWTVVKGATIEGGHYVPSIGRPASLSNECVTWGITQVFNRAFYAKFCDEAWGILSPEMLTAGKSLEGFNLAQLQADLAVI